MSELYENSSSTNISLSINSQVDDYIIGPKIIKKIFIYSKFIKYYKECDCNNVIHIYNVNYKEEYYNDTVVYDVIIYYFDIIFDIINKTYYINDNHNENYETNIIGNVDNHESTKIKNTCFLKGETIIKYLTEKPITFKKLIDDCF